MSPIIHNIQDRIRPVDIERLSKIIDDGGIAIIPVDTVYGLIGKAFNQDVYNRLNQIKGGRRIPYSLIFESTDKLFQWYDDIDLYSLRLIRQLLPGPVTFVLRTPNHIPAGFKYHKDGVGVRVPTDEISVKLCQELNAPIWASSANRSKSPPPVNFSEIDTQIVQSVDFAFDAGPTLYREPSTSIDLRHRPFSVNRKGFWLKRAVNAIEKNRKPISIIIVCTGNICRSPFAAHYLQAKFDEFEPELFRVDSAGTSAIIGAQPSQEMVQIGADMNIDLSENTSKRIENELLNEADKILIMEEFQYNVIETLVEQKDKIDYLGKYLPEKTIADPFRMDISEYRKTSEIIISACDLWAKRLTGKIPPRNGAE